MIGLIFLGIRLMRWMMRFSIQSMIALFAVTAWFFLVPLLLLPGPQPGLHRSLRKLSRAASRAMRRAL